MKLRLLLILTITAYVCFLTLCNIANAQLPFIPPTVLSPTQSPALSQPATSQPGQAYQSSATSQQPLPKPLPAQPGVSQQITTQQADILQRLSPEQKRAAEGAIQGPLTPEAIEALKSKPEFKGLKPEDVIKGKEILDKKDVGKKEPGKMETDKTPAAAEKKVIAREAEGNTLFDRIRSIGAYQDISTALKPFGYEFFQDASIRVATDRKDIPVPSQYVIGPGDEVRILLWGRVNAQHNLVVDRNGNITIPQIGPIPVAGMTFEDMSKKLIKQSEQIVGANIDITMGALKTIPIFVLGDVKRPGAYTIGSFSTMTDALLIASGPTGIGSMRNVQLRRKDKIITTFDLYDLFLKGDKSKDIILQAGDVVFVPVAGPLVGIAGNVKRPAIYELRNKFDLQSLFDLAGGIIPTAYMQQIQVERIIRTEKQIVIDVNDKDLTKAKDFTLQDADLIKVFNIVAGETNVVFLYGNVKRPGKYEYKAGMRLRDLMKDETEFLPETYFDYALIRRVELPEMNIRFVPINLKEIYSSKDESRNPELKAQDIIYVFSKWFFRDKPSFTVEGEVRRAGQFDLDANMHVRDAILMAGGLQRDAYYKEAELYRTDKTTKEVTILKFNPEKALNGDSLHNMLLQDMDRIVLQSVLGYAYKKLVSVDGEVLKPGTYQYGESMTIKDLVFTAGNVLDSAYLEEADVSFQIIDEGKSASLEHRRINLGKALEGDTEHNLVLQPYSRLFVKRIPQWRSENFVNLTGEVKFPGKYIIKKGETLSSVIERAGGYTDKAYLRGAQFLRTRVRELQRKTLNEAIIRLEKEIMAESTLRLSTAVSPEEVAGLQAQQLGTQKMVDSLRKTEVIGRTTIKLAHLRLLKGSEYDIELEDGDSLYIPSKNNIVNVSGAVMAQGSYLYSDALSFRDYVDKAGGYTRYADEKNIFVLKVDGSAMKIAGGFFNWNSSNSRWEVKGFGDEIKTIEPGDTIVIPEKLQATAWLRGLKDVTQVLAQVGIFASSLNYLFK
ncbi:MAG: SLBB domain-containing protein [Proteobacteria bacterium]|nr:SLBB domain-containing protein [Pseudomonadota bacterium]